MREDIGESGRELARQLLAAFKKRGYLLSRVFEKAQREHLRQKTVQLILARKIDRETREKLEAKARALFGNDKEIELVIAPDLIGGFQMRNNQFLVRASVRDFLEEAKKKINESF